MTITKIDLDDQAQAKVFTFGTTTAGEEALVTLEKGTQSTNYVAFKNKASAEIDGNLLISGNLTVVGSYDTQTVTNMNVNDKTIRLNNGGTTAGANASGIDIEGDSDSIIASLKYNSSLTNKWELYDGTTSKEIATVNQISTKYFHNVAISGTQNGTNLVFTLASAVDADSEMIMKNGQILKKVADYTISGTTVTFVTAPKSFHVLTAKGNY